MSTTRGTGKGPVKADHTIYKPGGPDASNAAGLPAAKTATERLRKTPSPTSDKLRKTPSPTSVPGVRAHTPSPTSTVPERARKSPSPRTIAHPSDKKMVVSPAMRPASTTPRKTPSPDLRRSPDPSGGGGLGVAGLASKRKIPSPKATPSPIKRSMSAVLPRSRDARDEQAAARPSRDAPRVSRSLQSRDRQLRRLITKDPSLAVLDTIAMHLAELRLGGMAKGARTAESATQTVVDAGTQTALEEAAREAAAGGEEDADAVDGEVAQIAAVTERTLTNRGITPTLHRGSRNSSASSDPASCRGVDADDGSAPPAPVQMTSGRLGMSTSLERPRPAVYASGAEALGLRQRPGDRVRSSRSPSPATVGPGAAVATLAWPAVEQDPTRMMRPTGSAAAIPRPGLGLGVTLGLDVRRESEGSLGSGRASAVGSQGDGEPVGDAADIADVARTADPTVRAIERMAEPPGMLEQLTALLEMQTADADDDEMSEVAMHKDGPHLGADRLAQHLAMAPDPVKMLSDGRHNAGMLRGTDTQSQTRSSPGSPLVRQQRPSSRGPAADGVATGPERAPATAAGVGPVPGGGAVHDGLQGNQYFPASCENLALEAITVAVADKEAGAASTTPVSGAHQRTSSWGLDEACASTAVKSTKSPKENGTSLFGTGADLAAPGLSLPVAARPNGIPPIDLRDMDRPHSAPGNPTAAAATSRSLRNAKGLATSRSDVSIGSPQSAFTSVSSPR